tara:strand:- start:457 stop:1560 length:1104 start_codon:yes stop_codon:yes gene_type:complete
MLIYSFFTFFLLSTSASGMLYTMQDLEALEGTSNYTEFFDHAKDVRPSLRGAPWKKITVSMADSYIDMLLKSPVIGQKHVARIREISKWEVLNNDEFYAKKRNKLLLAAIKECIKQKRDESSCQNQANEYFKDFPDKEFGVDLAKILYEQSPNQAQSIWELTLPMISSEYGEFYCNKTPILQLLKEKIISSSKHPEIHPDCRKVFVKKVESELPTPNAFEILMAMNALSDNRKSQYYLIKLLNAKELTTHHWEEGFKAIKKLGTDHKLRNDLLEEFKTLTTIPDLIFSINDEKKALVISKQISLNFPEFLDFYTGRCLKWLSAEENFPDGNPTPSCHNYFKLAKIVESSPGPVLKKYNQIMTSWKEN